MKKETIPSPQENQPHHVGGDPASLEQDPAQAYPTGGAGLVDPKNDWLRDVGRTPEGDAARPDQKD